MNRPEKVIYTAKVHTTGGRVGSSRSDDGKLDVKLTRPGTSGAGTNPEQLFAAGWSACYQSAMELVARRMKLALPTDLVAGRVHLYINPTLATPAITDGMRIDTSEPPNTFTQTCTRK